MMRRRGTTEYLTNARELAKNVTALEVSNDDGHFNFTGGSICNCAGCAQTREGLIIASETEGGHAVVEICWSCLEALK